MQQSVEDAREVGTDTMDMMMILKDEMNKKMNT
jgi:hypothetical protein